MDDVVIEQEVMWSWMIVYNIYLMLCDMMVLVSSGSSVEAENYSLFGTWGWPCRLENNNVLQASKVASYILPVDSCIWHLSSKAYHGR